MQGLSWVALPAHLLLALPAGEIEWGQPRPFQNKAGQDSWSLSANMLAEHTPYFLIVCTQKDKVQFLPITLNGTTIGVGSPDIHAVFPRLDEAPEQHQTLTATVDIRIHHPDLHSQLLNLPRARWLSHMLTDSVNRYVEKAAHKGASPQLALNWAEVRLMEQTRQGG